MAWESATPPAQFLVTPAVCLPSGSELPHCLWVAVNRLRTGVGRFGTCLYRWGMLDTPKCICGADEQSANHIIFDCNILRPPNCLEDLRCHDINNINWLEDLVDFVWTAAHTQEEDHKLPIDSAKTNGLSNCYSELVFSAIQINWTLLCKENKTIAWMCRKRLSHLKVKWNCWWIK